MAADVTRAFLSLGSNLGDRLGQLAGAVRALDALAGVQVVDISPVYETAPLGADGSVVTDQPAYLNCAVLVHVALEPLELREGTAAIERSMGRGEHGRWESRLIDIDLVLFGTARIERTSLVVPHPRMAERAFVLRPLLDLDATLKVPGIGALAALLPSVAAQGCVLFASREEFAAAVGPDFTAAPAP